MRRRAWGCLASGVVVGPAIAVATAGDGPDVVVSRLGETSQMVPGPDYVAYGVVDGIAAYSAGTTACNVGETPAEWIWGASGRHPVIAQNMYRWHDGRFEQIGMSWLKHSFCAGSEFTCGTCQPTGCESLGVGCADTYWASLNGDWLGLGPRSGVTPQPAPGAPTHVGDPLPPLGVDTLRGRLQVAVDEIGINGARYLLEAQYLTHDEGPAERLNNASWREVDLDVASIDAAGKLYVGEPAILAWPRLDPAATVIPLDVPGEGRFYLGFRTEKLSGDRWRYDYALFNLDSARAARSLSIPMGPGAQVEGVGFHAPDYHSGEVYGSDAWSVLEGGDAVLWTTHDALKDPLANALRWSTLYSFWFTADRPPASRTVTVGLFTPGTPAFIDALAVGPADLPCTGDLDASGTVDVADLMRVILAWGSKGGPEDLNADGLVDIADLVVLIMAWGGCP